MSEFVMGATLEMRDLFSRGIQTATRATQLFRGTTLEADRATGGLRDAQGRLNTTLGQEARAMNESTQATRENAEASHGLVGGLGMVKNAMIAVAGAAAVKIGFDWLVKGNADMETYKNTLAVVLKSEEKAVETLAWANKFAAQTPFEIPQIVEATTRMSAYGLNAQKTLGIVGDMASVMGKDLMEAVEAVADAQTGEVERLKEFGITKGMIEAQAKLMKVTVTNNQGQITDQKAFNAVLFKIMEDRFKGGMEMQSKTFTGMLSNAKDFVSGTGRILGKPIFDGMKAGLSGLLVWTSKLQNSGKVEEWAGGIAASLATAGGYFTKFKDAAIGPINYILYRARALYLENKPFFDQLGILLGNVFTSLKTNGGLAFDWLMHDVLPKTINLLFNMGQKVIDVAQYFIDNWSWIKPLVEGIALAFLVWGTYVGIVAAVTKTAAAAQWLLNIAMDANPMGLLVLGIGLLIGAGMLLVQNWDFLKEKAGDMWVGIGNFFKSGVNEVLGLINQLIEGINSVTGTNFKPLQLMAMGKTSAEATASKWNDVNSAYTKQYGKNGEGSDIHGTHKNGLDYVPFDGYRAELHKGERVQTATEARKADQAVRGSAAPSRSVSIAKLFDSLIVHGTKDMDEDKLADAVISKLHTKLTSANDILSSDDMGVLL